MLTITVTLDLFVSLIIWMLKIIVVHMYIVTYIPHETKCYGMATLV